MVHFFYHLEYSADLVFITPALATTAAQQTPKTKASKKFNSRISLGASFNAPTTVKPSTDGNMVMYARVFAAAVKYRVSALKVLSCKEFSDAVTANYNHASFAEAAQIAYTTTPEDVRELRDIVVSTIDTHPMLLAKAEVKNVVRPHQGMNRRWPVADSLEPPCIQRAGSSWTFISPATYSGSNCELFY